jgi:hypothetical protein
MTSRTSPRFALRDCRSRSLTLEVLEVWLRSSCRERKLDRVAWADDQAVGENGGPGDTQHEAGDVDPFHRRRVPAWPAGSSAVRVSAVSAECQRTPVEPGRTVTTAASRFLGFMRFCPVGASGVGYQGRLLTGGLLVRVQPGE